MVHRTPALAKISGDANADPRSVYGGYRSRYIRIIMPRPHRAEALIDDARLTSDVCRVHRA